MDQTRKIKAGAFLWIAALFSLLMTAGTHARLFRASGATGATEYLFALFKGGLITGRATHYLIGFSLFSLATLFVSLLRFDLDYREKKDFVMGIPALMAVFSSLSLSLAVPFSGAPQFSETSALAETVVTMDPWILMVVKISIPALAALGSMFYPAVALSIIARGRGLTAKGSSNPSGGNPPAGSADPPRPADTVVPVHKAVPGNTDKKIVPGQLSPAENVVPAENVDRQAKLAIIGGAGPDESSPEFKALLFDPDPEIFAAAAGRLLRSSPQESFATVLETLCKNPEMASKLTGPMDEALARIFEESRIPVEPVTVVPVGRGTILERWAYPYLRGPGSVRGPQWILKEAGRIGVEATELSKELAAHSEILAQSGDFAGALRVGSQFGANEQKLREFAARALETSTEEDKLEKLMPAVAALSSAPDLMRLVGDLLIRRYPADSLRALDSGPELGLGADTRETLAKTLLMKYCCSAAALANSDPERGCALLGQALALAPECRDLTGEESKSLSDCIDALKEDSLPVLDKALRTKHPVTLRGVVSKAVSSMGGQPARDFIERHRL